MPAEAEILVRVESREMLAEGIVGLNLAADDGRPLPAWEPGAHIELELAGNSDVLLRQYSLCGDPAERGRWRIAVLREPAGRGGSAFIHDRLTVGDRITVRALRNHFPFASAPKCLFIAGGIGITPILPMLRRAQAAGLNWRLVYAARSHARMAFLNELAGYPDVRVRLHADESDGPLDLPALLADCDTDTTVYSCGPVGLLDALERLHRADGGRPWALKIERFAGSAEAIAQSGDAFEVVVASTGERLAVPSGSSILSVLRAHGYKVDNSCRDGVCGTCETRVLEGVPDHRDAVLSEEERAEGAYMMVCVSRAKTPELVLDL